jgi:transcription elongation factor Elf1
MPLPKLEVPIFDTQLPSSKKVVKYRPFLVREHKILLMLSDADSKDITKTVIDLIDACTFNKLNMDELAFFDLVHLFVLLRKTSIGESLMLTVNCPCGTEIPHEANLNDVKTVTHPEHSPKIRLNRKISIDMKYPNLAEGLEVYSDKTKELEAVISCIKGIHEENEYHDAREYTEAELRDFVEDMNAAQFRKITSFFETMPKVKLDVQTTCPSCKKEHQHSIENLDHFFV